MARFYGNLRGARGEVTRTGVYHVTASVRSWKGSLTVRLSEVQGETIAEIQVADGSATGGRYLLSVPLSQLLDAAKLVPVKD
jgi:hypothetical protein